MKYSSIRGDRPTVKCLIVQASGWTRVDHFFFRIENEKKTTEKSIVKIDMPL